MVKYTHAWYLENQEIVHGANRYLALELYQGIHTKIKIKCLICGNVFDQSPSHHIKRANGCPTCASNNRGEKLRKTHGQFVRDSQELYGDVFVFLDKYTTAVTEIRIVCNVCSHEFKRKPNHHLQGHGCPNCSKLRGRVSRRNGHTKFLTASFLIHGDKFTYLEECTTYTTPLLMRCNTCGFQFRQKPTDHIYKQHGCPRCNGGVLKTHEQFVNDSQFIYGDIYDYLEEYINNLTEMRFVNTACGHVFLQLPKIHLRGKGCPICNGGRVKSNAQFLIDCYNEHGDLFEYLSLYVNGTTPVQMKHIECGHIFDLRPDYHLAGTGCPQCKPTMSINATKVKSYLEKKGIIFELEKGFDTCRHINKLLFDFYLPDYNLLIEYDGRQHFRLSKTWGGEEGLKIRQLRDSIKTQWCLDNNIPLIRIRYDVENIEEYLKHELTKFVD